MEKPDEDEIFFDEFEKFTRNVFKKCPMSHLEFTANIFQLVCLSAYKEGESVDKLKSMMDEMYNVVVKGFTIN